MSTLINRGSVVTSASIATQIRAAAAEGARLVLLGRVGSGRGSAVRAALAEWAKQITEWNLRTVGTERDLEQIPECGGDGLRVALGKLEKQSRGRHVLLIRDIDGCTGSPEERAIIGRLRGEVQGVSRLRIFYTASDPDFVARNFGDPTGPFYKQAVMVPVPDLSSEEIENMYHSVLGVFAEPHITRALIEQGGRRAGDVAMIIERLRDTVRSDGAILPSTIQAAAVSVAEDRRSSYASLERNSLVARQRIALRAIARGARAAADRELAAATGIPRDTLTSVLRSIVAKGFLVRLDGRLEFEDPFFRIYLAG